MHLSFRILIGAAALPLSVGLAQNLPELPAEVREQITQLVDEKATRNAAQLKMDSQLVYLVRKKASPAAFNRLNQFQADVKREPDNRILVDIRGRVGKGLTDFIQANGGTLIVEVPEFNTVRALLPENALEAVAARPEVTLVEPAVQATTNLGPVLSEGDRTHRADTARSTFGVDGAGIKIGVLSDGVTSLATSKATGELNGRARALAGQAGTGDEGTAMMEIVQDLLPGAEIYFATAFSGDASFAKNIINLQKAGCSVIVDDITYFNESPFQDMVISQAVKTVSDAGVLYFSSAGNSGNKNDATSGAWEGDFLSGGAAAAPVTTVGDLHDFGGVNYNTVASGGSSRRVDLFWSDPLGASSNDYDLFVLNSTGTAIARSSTNIQSGTQNPYEAVSTLNVGERIVIVKKTGAAGRFLHMTTGRARLTVSTPGVITGHNASGAENAFCVAASWVGNSPTPNFFVGGVTNPVETFSSDGPRRMFYESNGTPFTPGDVSATGGLLLSKPDITGADGGVTSVPGFTTFFGTSAAAPHVAAIAGMLKAYNPALTPAQVRTLLTSTALDIEAGGVDRDSGSGIAMALQSMTAATSPDVLTVTSPGLNSTGPLGGPFAGNSAVYTLTNTSGAPINWTVSKTASWSTLTSSGGTLLAGASTTVTCSLAASATTLLPGSYADTLTFTNTTSGFVRRHGINLAIGSPPFPFNQTNTGSIPDGTAGTPPAFGAPLVVNVPVSGLSSNVTEVHVSVTMSHAYIGDLELTLKSPGGTRSHLLFGRVGATTAGGFGFGAAVSGSYVFTDTATSSFWVTASTGALPAGRYRTVAAGGAGQVNPAPVTSINTTFSGLTPAQANGTWTIEARDAASPDAGTITAAALTFSPIILPSSVKNLTNLVPSHGTLTPAFSSGVQAYSLVVPNGVSSITLTGTAEDPQSFLDVGIVAGETLPATSGQPSASLPLLVGVNLAQASVTAMDGSVKSYTIAVTREGTSQNLRVPHQLDQSWGHNGVLFTSAVSMQYAYSSHLLRYIPIGSKITSLAYRLGSFESSWPASTRTFTTFDIQLSSVAAAPGSLSTSFATNLGPDAVTVRSGSLSISPNSYVPGVNGPTINFTTPYVYTGGNLLVTVRHSGNGVDAKYIDASPSIPGMHQALSAGGLAATTGGFTDPPRIEFTFTPPSEIALTGNSANIINGDTTPSATDHTEFGSVLVNGGTLTRTFTISNTGAGALNLTGSPRVQVGGTHAADFTVTALPSTPVAANTGNTTFQVEFNPSANGLRTATLSIANDDLDENPFTFSIQGTGVTPDINLKGGSTDIVSGDITPSTFDGTQYGNVLLGNAPINGFFIENTGTGTLSLTNSPRVQITGSHAADFSVLTQPASVVGAASSVSFQIRFVPSSLGTRDATVTISSNDPDESPYTFAVQGTGVSPEIDIPGSSGVNFGNVLLVGGTQSISLDIENTGTASLILGGDPRVSIGGSNAADFTVTSSPANSIAPGDTSPMTIQFDPTGLGTRSATVSIANSDLDENPYVFSIVGTGVAPDITLLGNSTGISHNDVTPSTADHTDFESTAVNGGTITRTFTIQNDGSATLNLSGTPRVLLSGDPDFVVNTQPSSTLNIGISTVFTVEFNPTQQGTRSAVVSIANDDPDEAPFLFQIQGTGLVPEMVVSGASVDIADGDVTPSTGDLTDFGEVATLNTQRKATFTIRNDGDAPLNLQGMPRIEVSGASSAEFDVTALPSDVIAVGDSTTFEVTFDPALPGERLVDVTIVTDDPNTSPYTFSLRGFGKLSPMLAQSINFSPPPVLYPSQSPFALDAQATSGLPVSFELVSGTASLAGSTLTFATPGVIKVKATQAGSGNYLPASSVTKTITVKAEPTTLTLIQLNQVYNKTPRSVGVVGTTDPVTITYKKGSATLAGPPTDAGTYSVKAQAGTTTKTGTLVIAKAPLTIMPQDMRKFAGLANPPFPTPTYIGFMVGDTAGNALSKEPTLSTTATTSSPGGLYPITSSGGASVNYSLIRGRGTLVVETFAGAYEALLVDGSNVPVGKLSITVPSTNKSFTAKLYSSAEKSAVPLSGTLTPNVGSETGGGNVTLIKNSITYTATFVLPLYGDVTASATRNTIPLGSATDGRKLRANSKVLFAGAHTAVLEPATPASPTVPAGAGWAKIAIDSFGVAVISGKFADGTAFTTTLKPDVDDDPAYRLFVQPYIIARTQSYLAGLVRMLPHPILANRRYVPAAAMTWRKLAIPADTSYLTDFGPVGTVLTVDPWIPPTGALPLSTMLGANALTFTHGATGSLSQADLPTGGTVTTKITPLVNNTKWTMSHSASKGTFTGSFELNDGGTKRTVSFSGVLRQPPAALDNVVGDGHFMLAPLPGGPTSDKTSLEILFTR
ncbi:MAG: choice-of-anchor D domain-containing protein [Verrucomicrobiaceae bacterium]|nr:choice-of-anchor D domain-containing protein [Verrucomicrobiaceae bacterium]